MVNQCLKSENLHASTVQGQCTNNTGRLHA